MEFNDLIIMIFLIWSRGASAKDAKSSCQAPQAYPGDAAKIVCSYNVDLSKEKRPFAVYRYRINDTATSPDRVLDCFWPKDTLWCQIKPGYVFDKNVSDQFTLTILKASEEFVGRYECSTEPIRAQDKTSCNFTLNLQTPSTAYTTSTSGRNTSIPPATTAGEGEQNGKDNTTGIVAGVLLVAAAAAAAVGGMLIILYRRRRLRFCEGGRRAFCGRREPSIVNADGKEYTLFLVGEKGAGKSSVGNTLLGRDVFETGCQMYTVTTKTQVEISERLQPRIKVVDAPDVHELEKALRKEEVKEWKRLAASGPHAILLIVNGSARYTNGYTIYKQLKRLWGDQQSFRKFLVVVFTCGDQRQGSDIEDELKSPKLQKLRKVLRDADNRYFVFNNMASPEEKEEQVKRLLDIVNRVNNSIPIPGYAWGHD